MKMGEILIFDSIKDHRGSLVSLESNRNIPFTAKRIYYLYDLVHDQPRGFHAHKMLEQVIICLSGSCRFVLDNGLERKEITLSMPNAGIYIPCRVWREMHDFNNCLIMVVASEHYDPNDYIHTYSDFIQEVKQDAKK